MLLLTLAMPKLVLHVTSAEMPDLLRLPELAKLLDGGHVSIQPDNPLPTAESTRQKGRSTRQKGREIFEHRATQHGLRVSTYSQPGVSDFIVESTAITRPVRLICSESPRISLRKDWNEPADLLCAFVWLLPSRTRIFVMNYAEVAGILGEKALDSPSFRNDRYYTTVCTPRRQKAMESFEDRWDVFNLNVRNEICGGTPD